jgi:hypothetical protein
MIKRTKKERDQEEIQIVAEICQNRTAGKDHFFENLLLLKSKSAKIMKVI